MILRSATPSTLRRCCFAAVLLLIARAPLCASETSGADTPASRHPVESGAAVHQPVAPPAAATPAQTPVHELLRLTERESQGLVNLGNSLTERGDYAAAEIAFRQVLNQTAPLPQTKSALLGLAKMHRREGSLTKAAAIYEKYLKEYPADERVPDALLDLGRTLRAMGAPKLAIARFYNVINSTLKLPSDEGFEHYQLLAKTAQFEVAETYFQTGDFAEATKFFSRLRMLDLAPADRARAHFKSAYSQYLLSEYEAAVTTLRAYLDQWPADENVPEARYLLSVSLRQLKRPQEALVATIELLRAEKSRIEADPKRWAYWQRRTGNQLANDFFAAGDVFNALQIYQSLAALAEEPAWKIPVTYQIGLCLERLGDVPRACATFRDVVQLAGPAPAPEIADLVRMAETRLAHVDWRDKVDHQVSTLFDTTTGQKTAVAAAQPTHDHPGSAPTTPPAL